MKQKVLSFLILLGVISMLAACGDQKAKPVAINEQTDKCATCNMQVLDDQFATQIILQNGKSLVFDDIGCMYKWVKDNPNQKIDAQFVRDYNDKKWVLKDDATYVYNQSIKTPMAYNVISFTKKADAEKFVADNAGSTLLTASELDKHSWDTNQDMMKKMQMNGTPNHTHSENGMKMNQ